MSARDNLGKILGLLVLAACHREAPAATAPAQGGSGAAGTVVATWDDGKKQVTLGELDQSIAAELYQTRRRGLETMVLRRLLQDEAKKQGKTEPELLKAQEEQAAAQATDDKLKQLYEQHKDAMGGKSFEEAKPMLKAAVVEQAMMAWLDQLRQKAGVKFLLEEPRVQVAAEGPSKGPADAPVTIVEFSDYQCPYCAKAEATLQQLLANYPGKVRLVYRNFPLPSHPQSAKAAEAGVCAAEQDKFWPLHDAMFAHPEALAVPDLKKYARDAGLDGTMFDQCLDSGGGAKSVEKDRQAADKAGVESTPSFFINGRLLAGAVPYDQLRQIVDEELAKKR